VRFLLTTRPGHGSLAPLIPIAQEMVERKHSVAFCSSPSIGDAVCAEGFEFRAAGIGWHTSDPDYIKVLCEAAGGIEYPPLTGMERFAWVTDNLFIRGASRRMLPDLLDVIDEWRPDVIVRESLEFAGCVAAERAGLPHASVAVAADSATDLGARLSEPLADLCGDVGIDPDAALPYRYLHLCFLPPEFDGIEAAFPSTARFFRHEIRTQLADSGAWSNFEGPRVLVSMGTVFHRTPGVYESVVAALASVKANVLIAIGFDQDPGRLSKLPPHVRVDRWLPLAPLLSQTDLFITHGGFNSVKDSLAAGVPMVVIPLSADQWYSMERCEALGVGIGIGKEDRTASRLHSAIDKAISDPTFSLKARLFRERIESLPSGSEAVTLLEQLESSTPNDKLVPTK
jgi:UDP:flavonoid glycosyltransferase YjiC (YdhE family)